MPPQIFLYRADYTTYSDFFVCIFLQTGADIIYGYSSFLHMFRTMNQVDAKGISDSLSILVNTAGRKELIMNVEKM